MSQDTWLHRISRRLVRPLADTPVRPNHLTTGRLVLALAAAVCFASDAASWNIAGALLFLVSMLLDRADGELARMQNTSSRWGGIYDLSADAVGNAAVFIGFGIAAMDRIGAYLALGLGITAGIAITLIFTLLVATELQSGPGAAAFEARAGFDPDDAMLIIPVAAAAGYGDWLLVSAGIFAPLAALIICRDLLRRRRIRAASRVCPGDR